MYIIIDIGIIKNSIFNKGVLALVGIFDCSLLELVLPLPGQCELFIVLNGSLFWPPFH